MEKTALVITVMKYYDIQLDRLVLRTEQNLVSLDRAKELIQKKVCELIKITSG